MMSRDCALDDSCVFCSQCFEATNHEGHSVSFFIAQQSGGCCDCGDAEAWREQTNCPYHPPTEESMQYFRDFTTKMVQNPPKTVDRVIPGSEVPPVRNHPDRAVVPPELLETMGRTVGYAIDYLLDTFDYSPDVTGVPAKEEHLWKLPSGDPMMMKDQFCVVLWNDDKHSFDEVIQLLCDMTSRTREEASIVADTIDEQGRDVIEMNSNTTRLLEMGLAIQHTDLGVTIRRAYDTFREQVSAVIIEWLLDLTRCSLANDNIAIREVIATELLSPRKQTYARGFTDSHPFIRTVSDPARLDWLLLYHVRLWKKPRLNLKEIYASLLSLSHEHKLAICTSLSSSLSSL